MASDTLFPAAGQLIANAADTEGRNADRQQREREVQANLLRGTAQDIEGMAQTKFQQDEATKRQAMQGAQSVQQMILDAKLKAQAEQAKYIQDTVEVPPEFASGMAKVSGNPGYEKLAGQRAPWKDMMAGFSAEIRSKYTKPIPMQIMENGKPIQGVIQLTEDDKGNVTPTFQRMGEAVPKPVGGKGGSKNPDKDLLAIEKTITADQAKLLNEIKRGRLPDEAFGGEPGNMRKLAQWISAGNFGDLGPEEKARVSVIKGIMTTMQEQNTAANAIRKGQGREPTDYTGFGEAPGQKFDSADAVKAAFKTGAIDRATAKKILSDQFGMK